MDDETLAELQRLAEVPQALIVTNSDGTETWPDLAAVNAWDHARSELNFAAVALVAEVVAARRELGDTRARLAAVETEATRLRDHAEAFLYDGDHDVALPGYVEVYGVADALAALGATDQAGGGG